jgi:hypothetical protein
MRDCGLLAKMLTTHYRERGSEKKRERERERRREGEREGEKGIVLFHLFKADRWAVG